MADRRISTFFHLPHGTVTEAVTGESKPGPLAGRRVLLAADAPGKRRRIAALLIRAGADVTFAGSAGEPPAVAFEGFDAALIDRPRDAIETAAALRTAGFLRPVLVILAAGDQAPPIAELRAAGCDAFLRRPLRYEAVLVGLGLCLRRSRAA